MSPSECSKCGAEFGRNYVLQAEARHELAKYGAGAARALVDEALNEYHAEHGGGVSAYTKEQP